MAPSPDSAPSPDVDAAKSQPTETSPPPSSSLSTPPPPPDDSNPESPPPPPPQDDNGNGDGSSGSGGGGADSPSPSQEHQSSSGNNNSSSNDNSNNSKNNDNNNNNNDNNNNNNNNDNDNDNTPSPPLDSSSSSGAFSTPPPPYSSSSEALAPPPPPPPAKHSKSPSSKHSSESSSDSLNLPLIIGVAAAVVVLFAFTICLACCLRKKKKKKQPHDPMKYYADPSRLGGPANSYYNSGPNWYNSDHVVKVPPPPGGMGQQGGMWPSPPPPPAMHSSDMSSNYSGPRQPALPPPSPGIALGFNKSTFSYEDLAMATGGFADANMLGQGGFGYVYKGLLPNGTEIAVKQLKSGSGQGEREFQAEVEIISRVHHRHLVSLVGYCIAGGQRMLVYEFVPNNTLEFHLHGKDRPSIDFPTRLKIALGSAKGLAYLHEDCHPKIIHRDIKTANILLDNNFEAMVADFGLAKLSTDNHTHVSTRVMGTFGYLAPEYASSGKLTEKSDVFSFGIMLLELITGRRPVDTTNAYMDDSLVDWAKPLLGHALEGGPVDELVDPCLGDGYNHSEMMRMIACAAAAVRHSAKRRPKMSQIMRALEGDVSLQDLNDGVKPGQSSQFGSHGSGDYDTAMYNADMMQFRKVALASQGFGSSEFSGHSSEYGGGRYTSNSSEGGQSREMHPRRSP
ncbi:hypothetical protein ACLOJK_002828 [Asimina triloba]